MNSSTRVAHDGKALICFTEFTDPLQRVVDRRVITYAGQPIIDHHIPHSDAMLGASKYNRKSTTFKIKAEAKSLGVL